MALITPGLFVLLLLAVWIMVRRNWRSPKPIETLLVLWFLVPALFFLAISPFEKIQANWLAPAWPAAFLALAALLGRSNEWPRLRRSFFWSAALGAGMVALVWLYALVPFGPCFRGDPLAHLTGQRAIAAEIADLARRNGSGQIFATDYATASMLRFYAPADMQVTHITDKLRYFGFAPQPLMLPAILVARQQSVPSNIDQMFSVSAPSIEVWRNHKGCPSRKYFIFVVG